MGDDDSEKLIAGEPFGCGHPVVDLRRIDRVVNGVVCCTGSSDRFGQMDISEFRRQGWIPRNWNKRATLEAVEGRAEFCDLIADSGGRMMEIAIGPGGGFFPNVLLRNPRVSLLLNDISIPVLLVWKELLGEVTPGVELVYLAFDFRQPVVEPGSLDVIIGALPFSSTGDVIQAVAQAHRALRVGGTVYIEEQVVRSSDWEKVPEETRKPWERRNPALTVGIAPILREAGFTVEADKRFPGHELDPEDGGLARSAHQCGVRLYPKIPPFYSYVFI